MLVFFFGVILKYTVYSQPILHILISWFKHKHVFKTQHDQRNGVHDYISKDSDKSTPPTPAKNGLY